MIPGCEQLVPHLLRKSPWDCRGMLLCSPSKNQDLLMEKGN